MATTHPLPVQTTNLIRGPEAVEAAETASEETLVPSPHAVKHDPTTFSPQAARLPVELEVAIPVPEFRVRNLLALEPGQVIETQWGHGEDMPLSAGQVQLAWSEFEVAEAKLAVRITRLA
ncbi:MAG: FliM/FliN family flagellar motor C-terminal domain-containing protein [Terracidiphilus sp.]|jgi:flagellar motor switch protein FliM